MEDGSEENMLFGIKPDSARTVPIIVGCVILVFVIVIILAVKSFIESNQPRISLLYTPKTAVVTVDGEIIGPGEKVLSAGTHEIKAEKYGFETETVTVDVEWGEAIPVQIVMTPNKDETNYWYATNAEDGRILERIMGYQYDGGSGDMTRRYPILKKLPLFEEDFYIYQQGCDEPTLCILIDTNEDYFDDAIEYFREKLDDDIGKYRFFFYDSSFYFDHIF